MRGSTGGTLKTEGNKLFKIAKAGIYKFDVIPYEVSRPTPYADVGELYYEYTYFAHFNVGPSKKAIVCPRTIGKKCPICDMWDDVQKDPSENDEDYRQALKPKKRQLYYIVDVRDRDSGIQIFESSYHNFGKGLQTRIEAAKEDEDEDYEEILRFADLDSGLTIKAHFEEGYIGSFAYYLCSKPDFVEREKQYDESLLEGLPPLDSTIIVLPQKKILAMFEGTEELETDEEQKDSTPVKKSKPRVLDDDDDEDEPYDEDEELEEEMEEYLEDEDEEEEEEEEEEYEPPRKVKKQRTRKVKKQKTKRSKCPQGGTFGEDWAEFEECADCRLYDECAEASDSI
jgi:hypothetical protein